MIKHIVLFRLAEEAEGKTKIENAQLIKEELEKLIDIIPELRKIEVNINSPEAPATNYDIALYSEFDNMEDLNIYQEHPAHKKVGGYIVKVRTERACIDYEV